MLQKYINSKQKTTKIKDYTLCIDNILKDFAINNIKENRIKKSSKFFFC